MNFLQAAEKLAGIGQELEPIKDKFPGVYSDFVNSLLGPDVAEEEQAGLFDGVAASSTGSASVTPKGVTTPKTITDHVRAYLNFHGDSHSADIVIGIYDEIESTSKNRRRVIQSTINNMVNQGDLEKGDEGLLALIE